MFIYVRHRFSSDATDQNKQQQQIQYRCSTPDEKLFHPKVSDKSVDDLLNGCTLINDTFDGDRSSTPLPSPSLDVIMSPQRPHPSVRTILQDSRLDDASFASSVARRSPRRSMTSHSFRDVSPNRTLASNMSMNQSRR